MKSYNHLWQINKWEYKELENVLDVSDSYIYLLRKNVKYRMSLEFISLYVPLNKYYIQINKVNKYLERVS